MDAERRIYINEDHPLNSPDKQADLGVHLNTTFSIASSKKIKLLFLLNFCLSLVCMVICFCVACYCWHELTSLRRQIDTMKDHLLVQNLNQEKLTVQSALVRQPGPQDLEQREPRTFRSGSSGSENAKKFYVEDLGDDLLFVDSKKKKETDSKPTTTNLANMQKDVLIAQFNGANDECNMGNQYEIGPWTRDEDVSSKNSKDKIELNKESDHIVINEGGLYLIYAQVTYLTHAPNFYLIWARQTNQTPRLLSMCATGDDSTARPLDRSQISCAVQTVARLYPGDILNLSQRDANRTLILTPGYSYFGFIKLTS